MFIFDGPDDAEMTILMGHGAGGPMDSASMTAVALAEAGFYVARFEFDYMAARRAGSGRKPPPLADKLVPEYLAAIDALSAKGPLVIGGKSMGGRVASMVGDECLAAGKIRGLPCMGYPFHPAAKPARLRTGHLAEFRTPTLIAQGTRDEFGKREEVSTYELSPAIALLWLEDGDHNLKPRKKISGFTAADHLAMLAAAVWT